MPEGDTIHRTATTLRRRLEGRSLTAMRLPRQPQAHPPGPGTTVRSVEARGKHLLIRFEGGLWLHTHMQMNGSWHTYGSDDRWRRPAEEAVAVLETADVVAVCFSAPVVELLTDADLGRHRQLSSLGPDLCAAHPDIDEALRRLGTLDPSMQVGLALLDQRVACGIGNVYRSETLFVCGVDPFAPVSALDDRLRRGLLQTASDLLRRNLDGGARATFGDGLGVYGQGGRGCPRCGTRIRSKRQGSQARTTWWCPSCQAPAAGTPSA